MVIYMCLSVCQPCAQEQYLVLCTQLGGPPPCFISLPAETVKEILYIQSQVVYGKVFSNHSMQSVIGVSVPSLI